MQRGVLASLTRPLILALLIAAVLLFGAGTSAWATASQSPKGQTIPTVTPGAPPTPQVTPPAGRAPGAFAQIVSPRVAATITAGTAAIVLPANAINIPGTIVVLPRPAGTQPPMASSFALLQAVEITFYDAQGNPVEQPMFANPVQVCFDFSAGDLGLAGGTPENLVVQFYDPGAKQWVPLPTSSDTTSSRTCGAANHLALFGLSVRTAAPSALPSTGAATAEPPASASTARSIWIIMTIVILLIAILLFAFRRRRSSQA